MVGIPCSGKSTYIEKLLNYDPSYVVLSTDNYIENYAASVNSTYDDVFEDVVGDAHTHLQKTLEDAIGSGKSIIWDQTNLNSKTRKSKLNKIPSNYLKCAAYFEVELDTALERNRHRKGKFIPEYVIKNMYAQFTVPTIQEGFDIIYANPK